MCDSWHGLGYLPTTLDHGEAREIVGSEVRRWSNQ